MKKIVFPDKQDWTGLCVRGACGGRELGTVVEEVLSDVRARGDSALKDYAWRFDKAIQSQFAVSKATRDAQARSVPIELADAIAVAMENISTFHRSQLIAEPVVETVTGVSCFRRSIPIERVAIYVPGGTAPLFSTLLMLAIPARLANVPEIVLVTPGGSTSTLPPAIALCAQRLSLEEIYLVGGAQAIGALAYGTETIRRVDKICGPGNQYVTEAKARVSHEGVAIDMPAGPSEVLVVADAGANPVFVAADLLSQAEHGIDSNVVLVTNDPSLVDRVDQELRRQVVELPRREIVEAVLPRAQGLVMRSLEECIEFSNFYAPEHLLLSVANAERYVEAVRNAGSVFLGYMSAESLGDYASGTNHVLPTNRWTRGLSGVSVDTFMKKVTFQSVTKEGLSRLAPTVVSMARAEGLEAHARAVIARERGAI